MKCIHCGRDSGLKHRQPNYACPHCARRFAFEPTEDPLKVTDTFFQRATQSVSNDDSLYFTERQLWYEFNRRLARRAWWKPVLGTAIVSSIVGAWLGGAWQLPSLWFLLPIVVAGIVGGTGYSRHRRALSRPSVSIETFRQKYLGVWTRTHGPIEKLLPPAETRFARPIASEPDLTTYSFDRALVTDQSSIAAMLVANNFHFENNCAVLSVDGYPPGRLGTILSMLRRNPVLMVFAVHNASSSGCSLPLVLRQPEWFLDRTITIFDLGLRPRHVIGKLPPGKPWMTIAEIPQTINDEVRRRLTPQEAAWLAAGNVAELAVVRPAALMRALYRGMGRAAEAIAKQREEDQGDGWIYHSSGDPGQDEPEEGDYVAGEFDDGDALGGDFGAADSFG